MPKKRLPPARVVFSQLEGPSAAPASHRRPDKKKPTATNQKVKASTEDGETAQLGVRISAERLLKLKLYCVSRRRTIASAVEEWIDSLD